jgi:hypothetical protein
VAGGSIDCPVIRFTCLYLKKEVMKRIKKIFRIKKETATATPKMEKAMLPKMEKRSK